MPLRRAVAAKRNRPIRTALRIFAAALDKVGMARYPKALLSILHQILKDDQQAPKKQRHTAKRIWERLRDEYGSAGRYSSVKQAVRQWKQTRCEVFLPLSHPPGEAQVDYGEATVTVADESRKVALFVMTLPDPRDNWHSFIMRYASGSVQLARRLRDRPNTKTPNPTIPIAAA